MPVAEHQLQTIPLRIQLDHLHAPIDQRRHPPQPKRPALRTRALTAQLGVIQYLLAAVRPGQAQLLLASGVAHRQRVHCS